MGNRQNQAQVTGDQQSIPIRDQGEADRVNPRLSIRRRNPCGSGLLAAIIATWRSLPRDVLF